MTLDKKDLIAIRDAKPGDEAFIMSTWLKGLLFGGDGIWRKIPSDIYYSNQHKIMERILTSPVTKVKVACLREDADVILGYAVYRQAAEVTVLDWVFVKRDWRSIGIAKSLCPPKIDSVTFLSRVGEAILAKKAKIVFNPFL